LDYVGGPYYPRLFFRATAAGRLDNNLRIASVTAAERDVPCRSQYFASRSQSRSGTVTLWFPVRPSGCMIGRFAPGRWPPQPLFVFLVFVSMLKSWQKSL
jgi:hypothetical protein